MGRLEGDLSVMPLSDVVIWLANRRLTGHLVVGRDGVEKAFAIQRGMAKRAISNNPREYFGRFLIQLGLANEEELQRAFVTQKETHVLLGRILVMIGIVAEEQVIQTLRVKVAESLLDVFRWRRGHFCFEDAWTHEPRPLVDVSVPLLHVHREGMARAELWAQFRSFFPQPDQTIEVDETMALAQTPTDNLDARILNGARRGLTSAAMAAELGGTDYQIASRLLELGRLGIVRPCVAPRKTGRPSASVADDAESAPPGAEPSLEDDVTLDGEPNVTLEPSTDAFDDGPLGAAEFAPGAGSGAAYPFDAIPVRLREPTEDEHRGLTAQERYVLGRVDGRRTLHSIIRTSPMLGSEAVDVVKHLEEAGIIRM